MRSGTVLLTANELHWLAGLLEAEGSFMRGTPSQPRTPRMMIGMTDYDVIERVAGLLRSGIKAFRLHADHLKPQYSVQVGGGSAVSFLRLLHPLMGQRRRDRIEEVIACYQPSVPYGSRDYRLADDIADEGERYWLAGYLEGEAWFAVRTFTKVCRAYSYPYIEVNSTDQDVIEHVQRVWRVRCSVAANMGSRQPAYEGSKRVYRIAAHGPKARVIMEDICPLMGDRRRMKIQEALAVKSGVQDQAAG